MNVFYNHEINPKRDLIVGGGIGAGRHDVGALVLGGGPFFSPRAKNTETVWNLALGTGYKLNDNVSIEFLYRYFDLGQAATAPEQNSEIQLFGAPMDVEAGRDLWDADQHELSLGIRYTF